MEGNTLEHASDASINTVEFLESKPQEKTMANPKPHVLAIPYPAQGHVLPLMELSLWLVKSGLKVTFVNTDFIHQRILDSLPDAENIQELMDLVSIPDGLEPWENRSDLLRLTTSILAVMPGELQTLIQKINGTGDEIVCVVADWSVAGWVLEVAERLGTKSALFWPGPASILALSFNFSRLMDDGIIDNEGLLLKNEMVQLSPAIPPMNSTTFSWLCFPGPAMQKVAFDVMVQNDRATKLTDWIICNSSNDLEPGVFSLYPKIQPIGPLLAKNRLGKSLGCFWKEETSCLEWLDQQPRNSVMYVAFGSFTLLDQTQFEELALGLEQTNRPFLWVVRQDINADTQKEFPEGFRDRVKDRSEIVSWAPQQQVLSHPSVACFISHCGWNSTVESIGNGVPILCWPYFADQFLNESYICDEWEVGLRFDKDGNGTIGRREVKDKVERLLSDGRYKARALKLQEKTAESFREGCSGKNLKNFIEWIKKI